MGRLKKDLTLSTEVTPSSQAEDEGVTLAPFPEKVGSYFLSDKKQLDFVSSGCLLLDCVLGGGYPLGRVVNIIGDSSAGKSLLGIEACINFKKSFPKGTILYHEVEAAFDKEYAKALGLPVDNVTFVENVRTVEGLFNTLTGLITNELESKTCTPTIYVIDSLDALSDAAELERDIEAGSYSMTKQKKLSEMFRRLSGDIEKTKILLFIISQVRDNIGVSFGEKYTMAGGNALKFYSSQRLWLAEKGKEKRTVSGIERVIGVWIKANCKKNKVGLPFRTCEFPILFGFGIEDLVANLEYLKQTKNELDLSKYGLRGRTDFALAEAIRHHEKSTEIQELINIHVKKCWNEIETKFLPTYSKY